jgi:hypothetical protein
MWAKKVSDEQIPFSGQFINEPKFEDTSSWFIKDTKKSTRPTGPIFAILQESDSKDKKELSKKTIFGMKSK